MPHERVRSVSEMFAKLAAHSPLVGVLGHRQVGKTTFLSQVCENYLTLDDPNVLARARGSPSAFVAEHARTSGTVIDECQLAPELFPALKEWVRLHKKPGQFFMSGSVRFTSRSAIRESLTGRIMNVEIFPFGLAELLSLPLPSLVKDLAQTQRMNRLDSLSISARDFKTRVKAIEQYLVAGGLPGVCFVRDPTIRLKRIEEQLSTILDRDLRSVSPIKIPYQQIVEFLMELALNEGRPINHTGLKSRTGIAPATQKKLLYALEAVFVIRSHLIQAGGASRWTYLFEDQAEWSWLVSKSGVNVSDLNEIQWAGLIYRNLRLQYEYRVGERASFMSYQTRSGVHVPLAIRTEEGVLGIIPLLDDQIPHRSLMAAQSFLKAYARSSVLFISKSGQHARMINDRMGLIPAAIALFE